MSPNGTESKHVFSHQLQKEAWKINFLWNRGREVTWTQGKSSAALTTCFPSIFSDVGSLGTRHFFSLHMKHLVWICQFVLSDLYVCSCNAWDAWMIHVNTLYDIFYCLRHFILFILPWSTSPLHCMKCNRLMTCLFVNSYPIYYYFLLPQDLSIETKWPIWHENTEEVLSDELNFTGLKGFEAHEYISVCIYWYCPNIKALYRNQHVMS